MVQGGFEVFLLVRFVALVFLCISLKGEEGRGEGRSSLLGLVLASDRWTVSLVALSY